MTLQDKIATLHNLIKPIDENVAEERRCAVSDDTLGDIKVLKWPELPQTSDEHNIDGLIDALLEAETAEQIIGCRNELLTAWMGWQAQVEPCCGETIRCLDNDLKKVTTELAAAKKERDALKRDAERWKYWKPRMIAADFEWGQFKESVLVFSLNCKVSADIDKSTDEAIAATGSNHVD
jgi:hypothetical protein